jgi:multidrug efflux pump subunit AcrB
MTQLLRHTVVSVALGVLAAGLLSALLMAILPASWRGPGVVLVVLVASVTGVVWGRGLRRPAQ